MMTKENSIETTSWSAYVHPQKLFEWCSIPAESLPDHPGIRIPYRQVQDSEQLGALMARELIEIIEANNRNGLVTRAIIPCGPRCWYEPFSLLANSRDVSLNNFYVFHMDECLDWQGRELPRHHPYNFRTFMETYFYGPIRSDLRVPEKQRFWLSPSTIEETRDALAEAPIDITVGGWGQDGHVAYNQANRHPFHRPTIEDLRSSTIRVQENNLDTLIALAHRSFGAAYQFVPPMSVTLGMRECMSAKKVRIYSDTGSWKQTALRVALFSEPVTEYPVTLLQTHPDALITATLDTARHPISENPDWELF
jgi:glucosamine-6-phosphate deaminase